MRYEIYVPRRGKKESWLRLLVDADTWAAALKSGLMRIGEDGRAVERALCDVQPNGTFIIRDSEDQRTFLLREIGESSAEQPVERRGASMPPQGRPAEELAREEKGGLNLYAALTGATPPGIVISEKEAPAPRLPKVSDLPRHLPAGPVDKVLPQVQREVDEVRAFGRDLQAAGKHVLELSMSWIPCESGSVLYTHINRRDLYFAAARGPKSKEVLSFRIPMGRGIVGFAAAEGTCLAVNDVKRDPRFFSRISEAIGHEAHNILAAPILDKGKVFGAIELINRKGEPSFSSEELRLLSFIGYRLARYLSTVLHI